MRRPIKPDADLWKSLMLEAAHIDYGEPLPVLTDEFVSVWSTHYEQIMALMVPTAPILEIGSGYGILAAGLGILTGGRIWATEHPSRAYLSRLQYQQFMRRYGVKLIANTLAEGLPFASASMGTIYCCDVIEHLLADDVMTLLSEISRILIPGGKLILSTPNLNRLSNIVRLWSGFSVNPPLQVTKAGATLGHVREFAVREMQCLLGCFGLDIIRCSYALNPLFTREAFERDGHSFRWICRFVNMATRLLSAVIPSIQDEMYILAIKTEK